MAPIMLPSAIVVVVRAIRSQGLGGVKVAASGGARQGEGQSRDL